MNSISKISDGKRRRGAAVLRLGLSLSWASNSIGMAMSAAALPASRFQSGRRIGFYGVNEAPPI
jgi:hypothetical protein